jgi:formylglycine-generating enzyme required for sulfatase activity
MKRAWAAFAALLATGCGTVVRSDVGDLDASDAAPDSSLFERDADSSMDASADRDASPQDRFVPPVDVGTPCAPPDVIVIPDGGIAPNASCRGPNGAPPEHCREAWFCGGPFTMGQPEGWKIDPPDVPGLTRLMSPCDAPTGVIRGGFFDAYEVSVARYRAFVRAGMPTPQAGFEGPEIYPAFRYPAGRPPLTIPDRPSGDPAPRPDLCTYRDTPGENDNLPVNCTTLLMKLAFCWWDGKQMPSEAAWEFVATNGGTTQYPFVAPEGFDPCLYGDINPNGRCPVQTTPRPIDAFPLGATLNPARVFGLYGGVVEVVFGGHPFAGCSSTFVEQYRVGATNTTPWVSKGSSFLGESQYFGFPASRSTGGTLAGEATGIRCMRRVPM